MRKGKDSLRPRNAHVWFFLPYQDNWRWRLYSLIIVKDPFKNGSFHGRSAIDVSGYCLVDHFSQFFILISWWRMQMVVDLFLSTAPYHTLIHRFLHSLRNSHTSRIFQWHKETSWSKLDPLLGQPLFSLTFLYASQVTKSNLYVILTLFSSIVCTWNVHSSLLPYVAVYLLTATIRRKMKPSNCTESSIGYTREWKFCPDDWTRL